MDEIRSNADDLHMAGPARETRPVELILEERASRHPWGDPSWCVLAVRADLADRTGRGCGDVWRRIETADGRTVWAIGSLRLDLHRGEVDGYRENLAASEPKLFAILRSDDDAVHGIEVFVVTACPYEAQAYLDSGEDSVEGAAMPAEIRAFVQNFIERQPPPEKFKKRQRSRKQGDPETDPFWRSPPVARRER